MRILGISAYYHDSAAALIDDGIIVAAAQEERFTRKKHDSNFPANSIDYCLKEAACDLSEIDQVVFYDKPFLKFERLLETYLTFAPRGFKSFKMAMPIWLREKLFQKNLLKDELNKSFGDFDVREKLLFAEHHLSHAASAFFPSPFEEAIVLTMDGVGEWTTTSVCIGRGNKLEVIKEIFFPHSLGLLYSAITYYIGFRVNSGEYKVMGLAPYGRPIYKDTMLENIIDVKEDGSYWLDQSYFNYCTGLTMTNKKFDDLFGRTARKADIDDLEQFHMDMAASIQAVTEEIVLKLTRSLAVETGIKNICLAGGVALNCVANGKLLRDGAFEGIWIQPAAGDAGGALGAALLGTYIYNDTHRIVKSGDAMRGSYLGPVFDQADIEKRLETVGAKFSIVSGDELYTTTAQALADEKAVGWFQGRMEFGPRALGGRSILGDPRSEKMQKTLNLKIKYRESFRPFAPSVLREHVSEWFEHEGDSPYMLFVADVDKSKCRSMTEEEENLFGIDKLNVIRSELPAITHVDYSARIQTVHKETNPAYYKLINEFYNLTACPVVINTSFNVRGEPIVCTPEDAFRCFMGTEMDILVIGDCYMRKEDQNEALKMDYKNAFDLD